MFHGDTPNKDEYLFYSNNSLKFVAKNNSHECK